MTLCPYIDHGMGHVLVFGKYTFAYLPSNGRIVLPLIFTFTDNNGAVYAKKWVVTNRRAFTLCQVDISMKSRHICDDNEPYNDVIICAIASQITSLTIVYSAIYSEVDQRKHQSSGSLAFVWWIHRWAVNSPHKWPVTRKMFPFDDVIMF